MDAESSPPAVSQVSKSAKPLREKLPLYAIVLLLALCAGVYLWKVISENNLRDEMEQQRVTMTERAGNVMKQQTREFLSMASKPFAWAIRSELLRENHEQVDGYFQEFVKEANVMEVLYVRNDGTVLVATDKKREGERVSGALIEKLSHRMDTSIEEQQDGTLRVMVPITGYNTFLGTVIITYNTGHIDEALSKLTPKDPPSS